MEVSRLTWVCTSSPVTMLPTARSAAETTLGWLCISSSTSRRHTPASITAWMRSFGPSDKYDRAQQVSASTSVSVWNNSLDKTGRQMLTWRQIFQNVSGWNELDTDRTFAKSGGGLFPLHRLDSAQTAFLNIDSFEDVVRSLRQNKLEISGNPQKRSSETHSNKGTKIPQLSTKSRHSGLSPAMLPNAQTA